MLISIFENYLNFLSKFSINKYIKLLKKAIINEHELTEYQCGGFIYKDWENIGNDLWHSINKYEEK